MIDIIPGILSENEFLYFTPRDYFILGDVLDNYLAKCLEDYINTSGANDKIVSEIKLHLNDKIEALTLPDKLKDNGIYELLKSLVPSNLTSLTNEELSALHDKLEYLNEVAYKVTESLPPRSKEAWESFLYMLKGVAARISTSGSKPKYYDFVELVVDNKILFYNPRAKYVDTGSSIISKRKVTWLQAWAGSKYLLECNARGISTMDRRRF